MARVSSFDCSHSGFARKLVFALSQDASKNLQNLLETFQGSRKNFAGVEWLIYKEQVLMLAYSLLISLYSF